MDSGYSLQHHLYLRTVITIKNLIRRVIYKIYRLYKVSLENKISLYDFQTIDIIKQLPKDATCIDIGVNEGQILQYLYKQCSKGSILGIEPIPALAKAVQSMYSNEKVDIQQLVLFDKAGELEFYYFKKRKAISGLKQRELDKEQLNCDIIKVKAVTLDQLFTKQRLDFIKMDVEGAEYNILKGAFETLRKYHPTIVFESGKGGLEYYGHTPDDLWEILFSLGYQVSTLRDYLQAKEAFCKQEFMANFLKGYDSQYIAH